MRQKVPNDSQFQTETVPKDEDFHQQRLRYSLLDRRTTTRAGIWCIN